MNRKRIGTVCVDTGMICIVDPGFAQSVAEDFDGPEKFVERNAAQRLRLPKPDGTEYAVVQGTTWGDGFFPVYAEFEDGEDGDLLRIVVEIEACDRPEDV